MLEVNPFNSDAARQIASGGLWMRVMFFTAIVFLLLGLTRVESLLLQVNQLLDGILFSSSYWIIGAFFLVVLACMYYIISGKPQNPQKNWAMI